MERIHFYITIGCFPDGRPGELFITVNKGNDIIAAWAKCWSIAISLCLQSGVTVETLYEKFSHQAFSPDGFTENKDIRSCSSVVDYTMSLMKQQFMQEVTAVTATEPEVALEELARDTHLSRPISEET
jgi:ribonucleoside-diphosphate reductase alpha chain